MILPAQEAEMKKAKSNLVGPVPYLLPQLSLIIAILPLLTFTQVVNQILRFAE
jgi:hypothetical protein